LYATETCALCKDEKRKFDALEMSIWKRMEKIARADRKTNVEALEMLGEKQAI